MNGPFEVLNPWAEADPIPLTGISPRLNDLNGKRIGLFLNYKIASVPIQAAVEKQLKERLSGLTISRYERVGNADTAGPEENARFEKWAREQDAIIFAVGD